MAYSQVASLTTDHTQCGSSDSSNFTVMFRSPVGKVNTSGTAVTFSSGDNFPTWLANNPIMINGTVYTVSSVASGTSLTLSTSAGTQTGVTYCGTPDFADLAHGGYVNNTVSRHAITVPADLVFSSDISASSLLNWDISLWDNTTGNVVAWVLLGTLSHSSNNTFYVSVGNSGVSTYQGGSVGSAYDSATKIFLPTPNGTALNAADFSSNGWTLTNSGGVGSVAGQNDGAAEFNALIPNYLKYSSFLLGTTNLSISLWVSVSDNTQNEMFVEHHPVNGSYEFFLEASNLKLRGASGTNVVATATIPSNNTWTHLAATLSSAPAGVIYVNGASAGTGSTGSALSNTTDDLYIGCYDGASYFYTGGMQTIKVANVVRSADWITQDYNNTKTPFTFITVGQFAPPSTLAFPPLLPEMEMHMPYPHVLVRM